MREDQAGLPSQSVRSLYFLSENRKRSGGEEGLIPRIAPREGCSIIQGDCRNALATFPDECFDCVICDPPYPEIPREYGVWTVSEWWELMVMGVIPEIRRTLKPTGSAVFILQPNSTKCGSVRGWMFSFQSWICHNWNMIQDVWWWNTCCLPSALSIHGRLMRPSVKACVWAGPPDCYRNQDAILLPESDDNKDRRLSGTRSKERGTRPSGHSVNDHASREAAGKRGGTTPFNLLPIGNSGGHSSSGDYGHGAGTPLSLLDWWVRYICPEGGVVCDPFAGAGTLGVVCQRLGRRCVMIEKEAAYVEIIRKRLEGPGS